MLVIEKKMLTVLLFNFCLLLQPVYGNETALLLTNKEQKIEMIQKSDLIFVCEYVNCSQINTQVGIFEIIDQLKGIGFSSKRLYINIPSEGKSDLKPKNKNTNWMPQKGSRWIVFVHPYIPKDGVFDTYRGLGFMRFSKEKVKMIKKLLDRKGKVQKQLYTLPKS